MIAHMYCVWFGIVTGMMIGLELAREPVCRCWEEV